MQRFAATLAGLLLLLSPLAARAALTTQIAVTGTGTVTLPPDEATVNATVSTNAENAQDAVSRNAGTYDRIAAAIVALGVARSDVTLSYYNLSYNPRPRVNPSPNVQYGYTVRRSFTATVHRLTLAGNVVDAATAAGATEIDGVSFGLADKSAASREATQRAVADATAKAYAIADAAHLRVVGISSITLGGSYVPVQPMLRMASAVSAPTTFDNSNVSVTVTVSVVFEATR